MAAEPPTEVREVAGALIAALGENLTALLWHGSWARGEQTPESDHDLIVVLKRIDDSALSAMRGVFEGRRLWSTYVKTEEELRQYPLTGRLQFHHGNIPLYGAVTAPEVTREGLIEDLRRFCVDISHECRYRLVHDAPRDIPLDYDDPAHIFLRKRMARWMYFQAKAAVMALKARELLLDREYPLSRAELRTRLADPDEVQIVETIDRWHELRPEVEEDFRPIALLLDSVMRGIVAWLDRSEPA